MQVIDSHTEGEPTRVVVSGGPNLGKGTLAERAKLLAAEHTTFYRSLVSEPYGQEAMVGVLLVEPINPECVAGVIFFDAAEVIGMCGHGTIGVAVTLAHMGKISIGTHQIETPVGVVEITLSDANTVTLKNVESYRLLKDIQLNISEIGTVIGDVAYGGNWFFIVDKSPVEVIPSNLRNLTDISIKIRNALREKSILGTDNGAIDHVVLYGPALTAEGHSRNFVLCPDNAYDRSPCGTGSSARLACLAADSRLGPETEILQESTIGSRYRLSYQTTSKGIIPSITGQAFVTKEANLIFNSTDPLKSGIELV